MASSESPFQHGRPTTAAPSTDGSRPPPTANSQWTQATHDDDEDSGMFSFLRPATGISSATPHSFSSPQTTFQSPPQSAVPDAIREEDEGAHVNEDDLSPAAAYARRSMLGGPVFEDEGGKPHNHVRKESGSSGGSQKLAAQQRQAYGARWEDQARSETSSAFGIDENGRRIEGMQMEDRGPHRPTRSEDEKMIAEFDALQAEMGLEYPGFGGYMEEEEDSPYPEVRASVSNYDDTEMPVLTFRTLFLGIIFGCFIGGMNCFFTFRYPSPLFTPIIIQTISYPIGKFLAWLLPDREWKVPKRLQFLAGETVSFNPGPFNIKEHTAIVIMVNAAGSPLLAVNFSVTLEKFWDVHHGVGFDFLLALSTSMLGFGVAGLTRRFLVWPASLIWPQNLVYCTLFNTLHAEEDKEGGGITRYQFFKWAGTAAFFWYFFPGFIFQALSYFSFICWIKPDNVVVNQLFGVSTGLGMSMITFDWSQIAYIGNPLVVPWWAEINVFVGFVLAFWILTPALYYSNVWYTGYLPISTSGVFDRFGASYNTTAVINVGTKSLNETAYQEYSPLFLPISYAMNYGLACALTTALITHTALYHGPDIWRRLKGMRKEEEDIHIKLMRNYKEVPEWWYMLYLAGFVATAVATVVHWETEMPVWGLVVSLLFGALYVLPGGFVYAMTTQQITLNILVEMMAGYMMPGKALGNSLFKLYAIQPIGFALTFVQDLKLGHYMKLPPRVTFLLQIMGMLCSCILQVGIKVWLTRSVHDLCDPHQAAYLSCPNSRIFFSSSITWGLIGPEKQFSVGKFYNPLLWAFLAGAIAPIPLWYMGKRYPNSWYTKVSVPVMLTGCMWMPPATGINFSSWFLFGYIFQSWARRRHFRWWSKFNFTLAASLDCGTSISLIFIFCTLYLPKGGTIFLDWWGNNVFVNTADYNGVSYLTPPEEGFGPTTWK